MWRQALIPVLSIALLACGGGDGAAPTVQPTATPTPSETATSAKSETSCLDQFPSVSLHHDGQEQQDPYSYFNWIGDDCAATGHPFDTMVLRASALMLPVGVRPILMFTEAPMSVDGFVKPLPVDAAFPTANGIEIDVNVYNGIPREPLDVKPVAEQELDLGSLPPGNYVVEIVSGWPEGSLGFAFRIEIVEAGGE